MSVMNPYNYKRPSSTVPFKMADENKPQMSTINYKPVSQQEKYLEQKIMAAKPEELVVMLYDGLVRFSKQAIMHIGEKDFAKVNEDSMRAQAIVAELQATLNMDYEISKQLDSLYDFAYRRLLDGNMSKTTEPYNDVIAIVEDLRDTWKQAMHIH